MAPHSLPNNFGDEMNGISTLSLSELRIEAEEAERKHGPTHTLSNPDMPIVEKLAALGEECGEVMELFTYDKFPHIEKLPTIAEHLAAVEEWRDNLMKELLQVANVAMTWRDSVRRGGN